MSYEISHLLKEYVDEFEHARDDVLIDFGFLKQLQLVLLRLVLKVVVLLQLV